MSQAHGQHSRPLPCDRSSRWENGVSYWFYQRDKALQLDYIKLTLQDRDKLAKPQGEPHLRRLWVPYDKKREELVPQNLSASVCFSITMELKDLAAER